MFSVEDAWQAGKTRQRSSPTFKKQEGTDRRWADYRLAFISFVIVVTLSLQLYAGFRDPDQWGWPFVAYPMYRGAHYENERLHHDFTAYVVLADGSRAQISPGDLGMDWWRFRENVVGAMFAEDTEALQTTVDQYCQQHEARVIGLELEDMGVVVTRNGMKDGLPPEVVASVDIACQ